MGSGDRYSKEYKKGLSLQWYNSNRPPAIKFIYVIEPYEGKVPNQLTLQKWIKEWEVEYEEYDKAIEQKLQDNVVASKVEMYSKIIKDASALNQASFEWLKDNIDQLTPSVAVRLWTDTIEIMKGLSGLPEAIERMLKMDDEELVDETAKILRDSNIDDINALIN